MEECFGIDFGTTNSAVIGRFRRNVTRFGGDDDQPFPSLVAVLLTTGAVQAVGRDAWNKRKQLEESCRIFSSAKMDLGEGKSWRIGPETWTSERVVAEVLKGLKERVAARGHGASLEEAVIAIPVAFSPAKREALRKAATEAGIKIRGFVSEPTAAVFQSLENLKQWPNVVVFDWGGGTLDIAVVNIQGNVVREIATVPKPLGGDGLDRLLAEWAHTQILEQKGGGALPFSSMEVCCQDRLLSRCEHAKREMADHEMAEISLSPYGKFGDVSIVLTEEEFTRLMQPKIDEALATLEEGVHRARLSFEQVHILMVGGSSKLKGLREAMAERGWNFSPTDASDWHVAEGAAKLASNFGNYISAQNVGVKLCDDTVYPIISAGQKVDHGKHSATFGLLEDTNNARFVFVESRDDPDGRLTSMDRTLGHLVVPAFGFTNEPIHLESHIDEDLLLHVTARSQVKAEKHARHWTYPELRFSYALPETT
jgi:molecular chaperone DnaK